MKSIHEECTKHGSLWQRHSSGYFTLKTHIVFDAAERKHTEKTASYLSDRLLLQMSSGTTGNTHVLLNRQTGVNGCSHTNCLQVPNVTQNWTQPHRFRVEVFKSCLHFVKVRKLCGSIGIGHQNDFTSGAQSSLEMKKRDIINRNSTLYYCFFAASRQTTTASPSGRLLPSPCSSPESGPAVSPLHTSYCTAAQPDSTPQCQIWIFRCLASQKWAGQKYISWKCEKNWKV